MTVEIENLSDGEVVRSAISPLCGRVSADIRGCSSVLVWTDRSRAAAAWPLVGTRFKAFVRLSCGLNRVTVQHGYASADIDVVYETAAPTPTSPAPSSPAPHSPASHSPASHPPPYFVRPVYIVCKGDDGRFQGPSDEDCSKESARRRLALAAELLQCFTAENLYQHGLGRRTFALELERDSDGGAPLCSVFQSELSADEARAMKEEDSWKHFAKELMSSPRFRNKQRCKFLAFMSFTRYHFIGDRPPERHADVLAMTRGHAALGGGGLALYGTGTLHTWPETLEDLVNRFTDSRRIDPRHFMDDSCYRRTHWANYSTSLGAAMHELGHALGLGHTEDGIMGRGFNDMYRFFVLDGSRPVQQPPADFLSRHRQLKLKIQAALAKPATAQPGAALAPAVHVLERSFQKTTLAVSSTASVDRLSNLDLAAAREVVQQTAVLPADGLEPPLPATCSECISPFAQQPPGGLPFSGDGAFLCCETPAELACRWNQDGGAHWSRSSAIALRYSKWFASFASDLQDHHGPPSLCESKRLLHVPAGLRLVEIICKGKQKRVVARWEYVQDHISPPTEFKVDVCLSSPLRLHQCIACTSTYTMLAVDNAGRTYNCEIDVSWLP